MALSPAGDDDYNAVTFAGKQLQECAGKLIARWQEAHRILLV
ncbi:MAG: hypothetical protein V3T66_03500 [Alphaproteobacteria bacterium]